MSNSYINELRLKISLIFTTTVGILMLVFGIAFILYEYSNNIIDQTQLIQIMLAGLGFIFVFTLITSVVGFRLTSIILTPLIKNYEALEQFSYDASHELKTPLTILNTNIDLAIRTQKYKEYLPKAKDNVKMITRIIDQLLEIVGLEKIKIDNTIVDIETIIQDLVTVYSKEIDKSGKKINLNINVKEIATDIEMIVLLLNNLFSNAVKHSPEGSTIDITIDKSSIRFENESRTSYSQSEILLLTQKFYKLSNHETSSGIGLALVKKICSILKWKLVVKQEGKRFIVTVNM